MRPFAQLIESIGKSGTASSTPRHGCNPEIFRRSLPTGYIEYILPQVGVNNTNQIINDCICRYNHHDLLYVECIDIIRKCHDRYILWRISTQSSANVNLRYICLHLNIYYVRNNMKFKEILTAYVVTYDDFKFMMSFETRHFNRILVSLVRNN